MTDDPPIYPLVRISIKRRPTEVHVKDASVIITGDGFVQVLSADERIVLSRSSIVAVVCELKPRTK